MSLRVLHVFDHSAPLQSGYAFRSLAILSELAKLGCITAHVTSVRQESTTNNEEQAAGYSFARTQALTGVASKIPIVNELIANRRLKTRVLEEAGRFNPDVIHIHSPVLNIISVGSAMRRLKIPVVYEMRSLWEDSAVEKGQGKINSLKYRISKGLETWALKQSTDHILVISEGLKKDLVSRGIVEQRISLAPNGVDVDKFEFKASSKHPPDSMVFGYIGSLHKYEGLALLVDAFAKLNKQYPETRLIIIGDGDAKESLSLQSDKLGLGQALTFTGQVPHARVSEYMNNIDALVYPRLSSRLTELVTPLKPLEAMAQGLIVIASDIGGHRELIVDRSTGMLFEAGSSDSLLDTLNELCGQKAIDFDMQNRAREYIEGNRQWLHCGQAIVSVYENVTQTRHKK